MDKSSKTFRSFIIFVLVYNPNKGLQTTFSKYEGAGNDFILLDVRHTDWIADRNLIARLCDRHFGIGADGLMTLQQSEVADCSMRYYNADGSAGEMCGNGGRCFALFAHHLGLGGSSVRFDSLDGMHEARLLATDTHTGQIELGMIDVDRIDAGNGWWSLNTGVPHYVEFCDEVQRVDVVGRGRAIRHDMRRFPEGTNVNFVQLLGPGRLQVRTYERGVETETLACGTGATAAAVVACHVFQPTCRHFEVAVPGGALTVDFACDDTRTHFHHIRLAGAARRVFSGTIDTTNL